MNYLFTLIMLSLLVGCTTVKPKPCDGFDIYTIGGRDYKTTCGFGIKDNSK